jgi:hypothetical protein
MSLMSLRENNPRVVKNQSIATRQIASDATPGARGEGNMIQ